MAIGLRLEDRLVGAKKFVPWKAKRVPILEENKLWDEVVNNITTNPIVVPTSTKHFLPSTRRTLRLEGSF